MFVHYHREVDDLRQAIAERDAAEKVTIAIIRWLFCFSSVPKKTLESLPSHYISHVGGASPDANPQCFCPDHRTPSSKGECDILLWHSCVN